MSSWRSGIEPVLSVPSVWQTSDSDRENDIILACRIALVRNVAGYPFPRYASAEQKTEIRDRIVSAVKSCRSCAKWHTFFLDPEKTDSMTTEYLYERLLIRYPFRQPEKGRAFLCSPDTQLSAAVMGDDHLELQCCLSGFRLDEAWQKLSRLDTALEKKLPCAFSPELGYLTSHPGRAGTGIQVSVFLHLPMFSIGKHIKILRKAMKDMGMAVYSLHDLPQDDFTGNIFRIVNTSTLGETEEEIIARVRIAASEAVRQEKALRAKFRNEQPAFLMNLCGRAYGALKYSYMLSGKEVLNLLSALRLGVDIGCFPSIFISDVNYLTLIMQKAHLTELSGKEELGEERRGIFRSGIIRRFLADQQEQDEMD